MLVLLAGCARFTPRPISPAQSAAELDARTLDNPAFRQFLEKNLHRRFDIWPPQSWDFETLNLAALYYHPSLAVARAQWEGAEGGEKTAAQRPNPVVSAVPGYSANPQGPTPWLPGVNFDIPIETMGKRKYRKARAEHLSESARLNIATTAWQVRSNLRTSLIDNASARQRQDLLQKQVSLQQQIVESLLERLEEGEISSSELSLVRIALARAQLDLADARRLSADARARVADAIGVPVKALDGVELDYELSASHPTAEQLMSAELRGWALQNRADVLGALADYAASQSALQLEIAKQYPDIHLGPAYQYDEADNKFSLAITAELPILSQNQGPIAEAEAHRTEAAAKFAALQARVISDIDRAVVGYRVSQENLATLGALATAQKKQSDSVQAQVQAGAADRLDLLNSQIELSASALIQLDGQVRAQQAFGALEDAIQRPIEAVSPALTSAQPKKETKP
ncbi:MAG TPA: TolC family protein [Verrucomicrobiae bacterium]|nr:TolC family protein [Verrucomicrobiae bacterium]